MLTAPEIKAFLIHIRGIIMPEIMHAMRVYRRRPAGSKLMKRCLLPSSRNVSSIHAA
jgi:hypothetical protein